MHVELRLLRGSSKLASRYIVTDAMEKPCVYMRWLIIANVWNSADGLNPRIYLKVLHVVRCCTFDDEFGFAS
jgi:hypothetical protein